MIERETRVSFAVQSNQPLIGVHIGENGDDIVCYFTDESAVDDARSAAATQAALSMIGAWSDLDWEDLESALERIRHDSAPTPPVEL